MSEVLAREETGVARRLHEIALAALAKHGTNTYAACDEIWEEVQRSPAMMRHLFRYAWRREVSALLGGVQTDVSYAAKYGTLSRPVEKRAAVAVEQIRLMEAREQDEMRREEAEFQAAQAREYAEYLRKWRESQIGKLVIGDKPVWEHSAATVRAWLTTEKRRWRTVELLIAGLPDDDRPIAFYRRPEEVAAFWNLAGGE